MERTITRERLIELVSYSPETGDFVYRKDKGTRKAGMKAGSLVGGGYWRLRLDGREYKGHRLAWLYVYGEWPPCDIDHINRDRLDNRIFNLRLATETENNANQGLRKTNTSGFKGVTWHSKCRKWQAAIKVHGKNNHLGLFDKPEDAHAAYAEAATRFFGQFARTA